MQDLEEVSRNLNNLSKRLKDLGDSLWHTKIRKGFKIFRTRNNKTWLLGG